MSGGTELSTRLVLRLSALAYAGIGASFLAAPAFMGSLVGVSLAGASADNDVRAVYGGVSSGLAIFFWLAAARAPWWEPALWAQVLGFGGLVFARLLSWLVVGLPGPLALCLHAAEGVGLLAGVWALARVRVR